MKPSTAGSQLAAARASPLLADSRHYTSVFDPADVANAERRTRFRCPVQILESTFIVALIRTLLMLRLVPFSSRAASCLT